MSILEKISMLNALINHFEQSSNRAPGSVALLAVSKGHSKDDIELAYQAGLRHFGENYLQEALTKIQALASYPIEWHFIGSIQSNKTQEIAQYFSWVHSVSRSKIAHRLNQERPPSMPPLNICIQVNIDGSDTKSGIMPDELDALVIDIMQLPRLTLRGLMVITDPKQDEQQQFLAFLSMTKQLERLNAKFNLNLDTLSMGMSDDLKPAIAAGSTLVRVGRGIFGERA